MACRHHPRNGCEGEHAHEDDYSIVCKAPISHKRACKGDLHHLLISGAVTVWKDGNTRSTMIKVTHATAMMPMGMLRCGFLVSYAMVATMSKPMNTKKITPAPRKIPLSPNSPKVPVFAGMYGW